MNLNDDPSATHAHFSQKIIASYDQSGTETLSELAVALLAEQKTAWPKLAEGYAALDGVQVRELHCHGYSVRLQWNPGRIVSSGARVDEESIRCRKCFLCLENLPVAQEGILWHEEFLVLCNPAPIFQQHYTISHVRHQPQRIEGHVDTLLKLARDFAPRFTVFYNGPKCGASAPDHLHFQACPAGAIPIEMEAANERRREPVRKLGGVSLLTLRELGRAAMVLEGTSQEALHEAVQRCLATMKKVLLSLDEEPMINILCSYGIDAWRMILFPRKKHRPDIYFLEEEKRVLISPASVDMGGLIITPRQQDFENLDAGTIERIFDEVAIDHRDVEEIVALM